MLEKGDYIFHHSFFDFGSWIPYLQGWRFARSDESLPGENVRPDPVHKGYNYLREIYFQVDPEYKGRFTVPTLYDVKQHRIVNNEV